MKTLEQIKEEVALKYEWVDWICFLSDCPEHEKDVVFDIVAKRYATEYAKEALRLASDSAKLGAEWSHSVNDVVHSIDKESILSENNLPKHR